MAEINPGAVDFVFEHVKDAPQQQLRDADALDSKVVQLFSAGSVIIGLAGLSTKSQGVSGWFLLLAVLYVGVAIAAFTHLYGRTYRRSLQADTLWRRAWHRAPMDIKRALIADVQAAYDHNKVVLGDKAKTMAAVIVGLSAEVVFVGASLIATRL